MTIFTAALALGALVVAALNYNQPRVLIWLAIAAFNFVATYVYFDFAPWWMPHAFVTGVADALVVILLSIFGTHVWERLVRYCYMLSILCSMSFLLGWLPDQYAYGTALEICNWLALLVMGGHGLLRFVDDGRDRAGVGEAARAGPRSYLHSARFFLDAPRRSEGILARARG
jgi:hypothetical protein